MRSKLASSATAVLAAAALAVGASALEGAYENSGTTLTFNADGSYTVFTQGITIPGTYTVEGDTVTVQHPADSDQFCMGATGSYTIVETDADVTFTTVEDACEARATAMAVTWTKASE
jgi:hypothetical protein